MSSVAGRSLSLLAGGLLSASLWVSASCNRADRDAPAPESAAAIEAPGADEPTPDLPPAELAPAPDAPEDLDAERVDAFVAAVLERDDEALALAEFLELAGASEADPRLQAMFAGWLFTAGERARGRELFDELDGAPEAALEVAALRSLAAQLEGDCQAAEAHSERARALLAAERDGGPRPTIWIDYPRALPVDARALVPLIAALYQRRCTKEDPIANLEAALALDGGLGPAWTLIGSEHAAADRPERAAEAWSEAIRVSPRHADAHARLGDLRESQCRFEEALVLLERAWALNPFDTKIAAYNLCFAYTRAGRYDDAAEACSSYAHANPTEDDADDLKVMANLLLLTPEAPAEVIRERDQQVCAELDGPPPSEDSAGEGDPAGAGGR